MKLLKALKLPIIITLSIIFGRWTMTHNGKVAINATLASVVDILPRSEVQ